MIFKSIVSLVLVFVLFVSVSSLVSAVPVTIESVHVDGELVTTQDPNRLDLERGQDLDVKVRLNAVSNGSDIEVHGFISGFEFNKDQPISDVTPVFDVESGVTYVKRIRLRLPDLADEDNYMLRILVTDRNGPELIQNFRIKVDVPRHSVVIKDVILNPETSVVAGRALIATVRVKNMGERDQQGVKIKVSIPDLGVSATDFMDKLESGDSTTSEELFLRVPTCAKPGIYDIKATIEFNEGFEAAAKTGRIEVLKSDACPVQGTDKTGEKTTITVSTDAQSIVAGEGGAVYPVTITNQGSSQKAYTLVVDGYTDWGNVRLSPSNVVVVNAGESKTVSLFVSAKPEASEGEKTFSLTVKDQAGNSLQQILMKARVQPKEGGLGNMRRLLEIGLIVLAVIVIVIALLVIFSRMRGKEEEPETETKTYY
ncbi:hypothetical protein HYU11_02755 [Candidatus Woesearchaeota archaeon]|nr:hypothetical protein [Candidatus Woesearchaeota archaeon]